jgi:D-3-phosphoglycerate dehydrogenase
VILALICGRKDKFPFPGRNTVPVLGRPMMTYPLLAALHASGVERTFLTTDDECMARIARHLGAEAIMRPSELEGQDVTLEEVIADALKRLAAKENIHPDVVVVLLANAPTVTAGMIEQGFALLQKDERRDAVASVTLRNDFAPQYALRLNEEGLLRPSLSPGSVVGPPESYFPDALLWVLRARVAPSADRPSTLRNQIVDPVRHRVAPLVHEGYGDIDFAWQIPAAEDWLRRRGFDDQKTPYDDQSAIVRVPWRVEPGGEPARRVLISTAPFCEIDPGPMEALRKAGLAACVNPLGRRLREDDLAEVIAPFGALVAGTEPITRRVMERAPHLKLIARVGIGLDNVDLAAARERGIRVTYTPEAPAPAVAELTVGLMLAVLRHIPLVDRQMRNGVWHRLMGRRLSECTVGVVGVGRIGGRVIRHLMGAFPGIRILASDIAPDRTMDPGVRWVGKEELWREADVVTLHVPLTPETRSLVSAETIEKMKPSAILVNTSRGGVVNERDLADALRSGRLAGAAVDVFDREPYSGELTSINRCVLTSHMGSMSRDCRARMEQEAVDEVVRFVQGLPPRQPVPKMEYDFAVGRLAGNGEKGAFV